MLEVPRQQGKEDIVASREGVQERADARHDALARPGLVHLFAKMGQVALAEMP